MRAATVIMLDGSIAAQLLSLLSASVLLFAESCCAGSTTELSLSVGSPGVTQCTAVLQICNDWAVGGKGGLAKIKGDLWNLDTVFLSFLDWPLRK